MALGELPQKVELALPNHASHRQRRTYLGKGIPSSPSRPGNLDRAVDLGDAHEEAAIPWYWARCHRWQGSPYRITLTIDRGTSGLGCRGCGMEERGIWMPVVAHRGI